MRLKKRPKEGSQKKVTEKTEEKKFQTKWVTARGYKKSNENGQKGINVQKMQKM